MGETSAGTTCSGVGLGEEAVGVIHRNHNLVVDLSGREKVARNGARCPVLQVVAAGIPRCPSLGDDRCLRPQISLRSRGMCADL